MGRTSAAAEPASRLMHLIDGFVTTQLLYVAARLGVAEVLANGPRSGEEIAAAVGVESEPLTRVLRGLVVEEVLDEQEDGRFALTPIGESMRAMGAYVLTRGDMYYKSAASLLDAVRHGGTPFERVFGEPFFDHLDHDADHEAMFEASMAARAPQEAGDVVDAYDFAGLGRIVDVGGGRGILLDRILRSVPTAHGVVFDREAVIPTTQRFLASAGLADRTDCVPGDFFDSVPPGADAYVLSRIIHDWDDSDAGRILDACRRAMTPTSRLLIVDAVLPERARDAPAAIRMDLLMLLLLGARERTEAEFRRLLADSGLELRRVVPTRSPVALAVIEARLPSSTSDAARPLG